MLGRERDQKILIGDDIIVSVVDIRGDRVRLGIEAPPHVRIDREEIAQFIKVTGVDSRPPLPAPPEAGSEARPPG